jgi:Flp pilus assembly protein TadD
MVCGIPAKRALIAAAVLAFGLAGCGTIGTAPLVSAQPAPEVRAMDPKPADAFAPEPNAPTTTITLQDPKDVKYYPSDEPLHLANEQFNRGNYGLAERYYRDAVEKAPRDATAWIGLAASYDRIGRFDLADRAYHAAIKLVGETTEILNNEGYSYMLRGDLVRARQKLVKAYVQEPNNPTIVNNLKLLNASDSVIRREVHP